MAEILEVWKRVNYFSCILGKRDWKAFTVVHKMLRYLLIYYNISFPCSIAQFWYNSLYNYAIVLLEALLIDFPPSYFLILMHFHTADTDLLKVVPVEILLNFGNYFCTLELGFEHFFQELCFFITITKNTLCNFSFYRLIRLYQSPEPLIPLKNL